MILYCLRVCESKSSINSEHSVPYGLKLEISMLNFFCILLAH